MTEAEREELIEKMAKVMWEHDGPENRRKSRETGRIIYLREARAALAVAEPVIREQADNALREEITRLREALVAIAKIKNELCGPKWQEIEKARKIARAAIRKESDSETPMRRSFSGDDE